MLTGCVIVVEIFCISVITAISLVSPQLNCHSVQNLFMKIDHHKKQYYYVLDIVIVAVVCSAISLRYSQIKKNTSKICPHQHPSGLMGNHLEAFNAVLFLRMLCISVFNTTSDFISSSVEIIVSY